MSLRPLGCNLASGFQHDRENLADFAHPAAGEKTNQIRIACFARPELRKILDHRMADEDGAQSRFVVELGLEREDAEHQIEKSRHLLDSPLMPGPNLRTDVVNYSEGRRFFSQGASETQVESGIIDQDHCVGLDRCDLAERVLEFFPEIPIPLHDFPKPDDGGGITPVDEGVAGNRLHFRATASEEIQLGSHLAKRSHQGGPMFVTARLPRDK